MQIIQVMFHVRKTHSHYHDSQHNNPGMMIPNSMYKHLHLQEEDEVSLLTSISLELSLLALVSTISTSSGSGWASDWSSLIWLSM